MLVPVEEEQRETKYIIKADEEDYLYAGVDQVKHRVVVHMAASPTRTNFLKRWALIMTEVAELYIIDKDAPIDLIYDYTEAKPVPPNLKVVMFTKALFGAGMLFPNLQTWRVVPGDPSKNAFLHKFSRKMSSSWLPLRKNGGFLRVWKKLRGTWMNFGHRNRRIIIGNPGGCWHRGGRTEARLSSLRPGPARRIQPSGRTGPFNL